MGVVRALLDTVISLDFWFCTGGYTSQQLPGNQAREALFS